MERNPRTLAALVMQQLHDTGQQPTPENFARLFYEFSVKPLPKLRPDLANILKTEPCQEFVRSLKELIEETTGITEHLAEDLGSKNHQLQESAVRLKDSHEQREILRIVATMLAQASGIQDTVEASRHELREAQQTMQLLQEKLEEAHRMLGEDALTGTLNRRGLDETLTREVARAQRTKSKLTVVMADLDHFKAINDAHGHEAGDRMIAHFAELIRSALRQSDALARYGGEEFVIVLGESDLSGAEILVHRLQTMLAKSPLMYERGVIATTFSAGIAELKNAETGVDLLRRADVALYAAKAAGRNCFRVAP